jgi:hypothetical protein
MVESISIEISVGCQAGGRHLRVQLEQLGFVPQKDPLEPRRLALRRPAATHSHAPRSRSARRAVMAPVACNGSSGMQWLHRRESSTCVAVSSAAWASRSCSACGPEIPLVAMAMLS